MSSVVKQVERPLFRLGAFSISMSDVLVALLLALTVYFGASFRLMSTNWSDFTPFHPDERYLTMNVAPRIGGDLHTCADANPACAAYMERVNQCRADYPETNGRGPFFDADCSPYNPENVLATTYSYGTLPMFMVHAASEWMVERTQDFYWQFDGIVLIWRTLSGIAESIVILLTFLIGLRLHGKWVGLVAAVLYAFAPFSIQQAHFGTADAITNLFVVLGLYFMVRLFDTDSMLDYALFGAAVGAAVASRINVAPLAFVLAVPVLVRMLPAFDQRVPWRERSQHFYNPLAGGILAALVAFIAFRVGNPYAFTGPGFLGVGLNDRFLSMLEQAQFNVGGEWEAPPNWQWVNRTPFLFSLSNMVLWGMGIAMGLMGWLGFGWSAWRLVRGKVDATRNLILTVWVAVYFVFAGGLWVMSMRYYLPLYAPMAIFAAWMVVSMVRGAWAKQQRLAQVGAAFAFVGVVGFTMLWGVMFTNIYRNMATFNQAGHYTWERIPGDFYMSLDGVSDDVPLINIDFFNARFVPSNVDISEYPLHQASRLRDGVPVTRTFTPPQSGTISSVNAYHLVALDANFALDEFQREYIADWEHSDAPRTIRIEIRDSAGDIIGMVEDEGIFPSNDNLLGEAYTWTFEDPITVQSGEQYTFSAIATGGTMLTAGAVMASELPWDEVIPPKVCYPLPNGLTLADNPPPGLYDYDACNSLGNRAPWEGLVQSLNLELTLEDTEFKRDYLQAVLDNVDYVWVNTNRRYDSHARIPMRWPMTNAYYEALFDGSLGFELEYVFQETFELGPLKISDQHLPFYDSPGWLNEFEAEEAFTVYDHPVVMLFRKTDAYSSENTELILGSVPLLPASMGGGGYNTTTLVGVLNQTSLQADEAPTHLMFTPEMEEIQESGGTWSARFDRNSIVNTNDVIAAVVWWLVVMAIGVIVWPLLFVAFPGLADRGYGFAKIIGMAGVAWLAWSLGTMRFELWSRSGLLLILGVVAFVSGAIAWRRRAAFGQYLRARWRLLLTIEVLGVILYVAFIFVRLSNPDLWHFQFGGEKPMDFAYFNGVLRSTIFPAIDPWFADGYINYYYFGFVIVGVPTLITGIMPQIAYNLIIPMLFSVTGLGAFSAAFSLVNSWRVAEPQTEHDDAPPKKRRLGNPYVAGIMALLLAVVFGNLDTARVFGNGVAQLGGYQQPVSLYDHHLEEVRQEFTEETGQLPSSDVEATLRQEAQRRTESMGIFDRVGYELDITFSLVRGLIAGTNELIQGRTPVIGSERWFWGPTRIITEIPRNPGVPSDGAIHEMPYFTFLYGDLHAHMMSMPLMLFALTFVFHEVLVAGRDRRRFWGQFLALMFGGATVGLFQAVNTWDYPTFMILGVLGLGFAWWLAWERISRWSLLNMVLRVGGFLVLAALAAAPFTFWFASGITDFKIWDGNKTPLWAYFTIHGFFLFLIVSLLIWETARWMSAVKLKALRGKQVWVSAFFVALSIVLFLALIAALVDYQVALIVLPLIFWIAVLFFRPGQSRAMQYALVITGLGLAITLGTEIITLATDNGRQNTIFKFYIQVWLIFSVVGGAALAWVVQNSGYWRFRLALPWYTIFALMFFIAAMFPVMATRGKAVFRFTQDVPVTLDGLAYMQHATHNEPIRCPDGTYYCPFAEVGGTINLENDYQVISWLQDNVQGSPTIIEAVSFRVLYQWGGRIAVNTGLPSVVGWDYHQTQQRSFEPLKQLIAQRIGNVNAFYTTLDEDAALEILRYYDVHYIVVSDYERLRYEPDGGLDKLERWADEGLLTAHTITTEATIYEVDQAALDQYKLEQIAAARQQEAVTEVSLGAE